jgi:plasmid stabilization system protein ParE
MKVVWTQRARQRLQEILGKISEDQPLNAHQFVERIIRRAESLLELFERGRRVPEYQSGNIREIFEGDYRIIYLTSDSLVSILTVRHTRELLPLDQDLL